MNLNDNSTDRLLAECIAERNRLRRIIETTNLLMVEIDAGGRITYINPECQRVPQGIS
ncbi:PAS domain-containing protein [Chloroflexus sp.]|uniref:PAS domain-containing protein n=1 Tax=Chloroflexus sp. TaxID=1904827 RepID=UPI003A0FE46C